MKIQVIHQKDPGRVRARQEDHCFSYNTEEGSFLVLSDGMGGHAGGDLASKASTNAANQLLQQWLGADKATRQELSTRWAAAASKQAPTDSNLAFDDSSPMGADLLFSAELWPVNEELASDPLRLSIGTFSAITLLFEQVMNQAQQDVCNLAVENPLSAGNAGCTLTMALLQNERLSIGHIGDSRAYLYRNGQLTQLTRDHSGAMLLVAAGLLDADKARFHPNSHSLYRFLGINAAEASFDLCQTVVQDNDLVLLCSDGLWGMVEDNEIAEILATKRPLAEMANALIEKANANGGDDNISVSLALV